MAKTNAIVELYYGGAWHDVTGTDDVLTRDPIRITRGRPNAAQQTPPSSLSLSLRNEDGLYSPRNPMSPLYRLIGRNTPIRVSVSGYDITVDSFDRIAATGWGATEYDGSAWTSAGAGGTVSATDYHITTPGTAVHSVPAASAFRLSYLTTPVDVDATVTARVRFLDAAGAFDVTGNDVEGGLMLRIVDLNHYYHPRIEFNADQSITASLHAIGGTGALGSATVSGITYSGQWLRVKAQALGSAVRMKIWEDGTAEPTSWALSVTNTEFTAAGGVGMRSGVAASNTNTGRQLHYQDLTIDPAPRFTGEVAAWPQDWTTDGNDVWVSIDAAGIMLRLTAPGTTQRVLSAITSTVLSVASPAPLAYYPLNDGADSTSFSNLADSAVSGLALSPCKPSEGGNLVQDVTLLGFTPDQSDSNHAFSLPETNVVLPISPHTSTGTYTITFWHRFVLPHPLDSPYRNYHESIDTSVTIDPFQDPTLQDQASVFHRVDFTGGVVSHVDFRMQQAANAGDPDHVYLNVRNAANSYIGGPDGSVSNLSDGQWHEIRAILAQNGSVVDTFLYVDGVQVSVGSSTSTATLGTATAFGAGAYGGVIHPWIPAFQDETWAAYGLAHVSVHTAITGTFYGAVNGYAGETAGRRIKRLCTERGVAFNWLGDLDDSTVMGEQRLLTFVDAVYDAVDVDAGILYEPRGFLGLTYRTRKSLYNQTPRLILDYGAGGEVAPPLKPVEDWDAVANEVTVTRYGGGRATAVQATGPLNIQEPTADPGGVGQYRKEPKLALYTDSQNLDHAAWIRHLGTWDEARYPVVNVDITAMAVEGKTALIGQAASLDVGDLFNITSPPAWLPREDIAQQAQGFTEVLESHRWNIGTNATPAGPYVVAVLQSAVLGRLDSGDCTLNEALDTTETGVDVISVAVRWIDSTGYASSFPFDVLVAGERMRVTACSGTGLTQTFTVTRSINGVVKSHASGTPVRLFTPMRLAL